MQHPAVFLEWYSLLNSPYRLFSGSIGALSQSVPLPVLAALLLGLLGSISPCQLTGNASAMAYVGHRVSDRRFTVLALSAFIAGKAVVYTALGIAFMSAGREAATDLIPVVQVARKALGPLFLLMGLWLIGVVRLPQLPALSVPARLQRRLTSWGIPGAFLLGMLLSLAFCPTLFLLFFGITLPLGMATGQGYIFPGAFAIGTSIPLLVFGAFGVAGSSGGAPVVRGTRRLDRPARRVAGVVLVLAGLNDTLVYWLL